MPMRMPKRPQSLARSAGAVRGRSVDRLTFRREDGSYAVAADALSAAPEGYAGNAIERLAAFENAIGVVEEQLAAVEPRLEELKAAGRIRGAQAQQLLAQKLTYTSMLHMLER